MKIKFDVFFCKKHANYVFFNMNNSQTDKMYKPDAHILYWKFQLFTFNSTQENSIYSIALRTNWLTNKVNYRVALFLSSIYKLNTWKVWRFF